MNELAYRIYPAHGTLRRFAGLREEMQALKLKGTFIAKMTGIPINSIRRTMRTGQSMSIPNYMKLGAFMGWDMSHDINYQWYNKVYSFEQVVSMCARVHMFDKDTFLASGARYFVDNLQGCYNGASIDSAFYFGVGMYCIRSFEIQLDLPNKLDIEI